MNIKRLESGPVLSQAVEYGTTVYFSGLTADDLSAGAKGQTEQILAKLDALLAKTTATKTSLLSAHIYVADISTKAQINEAWRAWIDPDNLPARAVTQAALGAPDVLVEIVVVAARQG